MNQRITTLPRFYQMIWVVTGISIAIFANFVSAYTTSPPWLWLQHGIEVVPLNVSCQIAAVLLIASVGGRAPGTLVQAIYLFLGITGLFKVFHDGGGWGYWQNPSFGYLLGFLPASWLCGSLAFRLRPTLENLSMSCVSGLVVVHICGLFYLFCLQIMNWLQGMPFGFQAYAMQYSLNPLPSQLMLACGVAVVAYILRKLLLY
jgi:biotin transport system substrate-specific component